MIAEWATGTYPFPGASPSNVSPLSDGERIELNVPASLERLLDAALQPVSSWRPTLDLFLAQLRQLDPRDLKRTMRL